MGLAPFSEEERVGNKEIMTNISANNVSKNIIKNVTYAEAVCNQPGIKGNRKLQPVQQYGRLHTYKNRLVIIEINNPNSKGYYDNHLLFVHHLKIYCPQRISQGSAL